MSEPEVIGDLPSTDAFDLRIRTRNGDGTVTEHWVSFEWLFGRIMAGLTEGLRQSQAAAMLDELEEDDEAPAE